MNITLAIDDQLVEKARELARKQGVSLQEMIRGYLSHVTGASDVEASIKRLHALEAEALKAQRGKKRVHTPFNRDELYEERFQRFLRHRDG